MLYRVSVVLRSQTVYIHMVPLKCLTIADGCVYVGNRHLGVLGQVQVELTTRTHLNYMSTCSSKDSIFTSNIHLIIFTIAEAIIFMLHTIDHHQIQSIDDTIAICLSKQFTESRTSNSRCIILTISPGQYFTLTDDYMLSCINSLRQYLHIQRKDCIYTT